MPHSLPLAADGCLQTEISAEDGVWWARDVRQVAEWLGNHDEKFVTEVLCAPCPWILNPTELDPRIPWQDWGGARAGEMLEEVCLLIQGMVGTLLFGTAAPGYRDIHALCQGLSVR